MTLRHIKKRHWLLALALFCFWGAPLAQASTQFSISPLNPETGAPQSNYYDLTVTPNQEKDIKVRIFNSQNQDLTVNVQANEAGTNMNGVITYAGEEQRDQSLKLPFSSFVTPNQQQVVIPKQSSKDVTLHIKVPEQAFSGILLGGIRVTGSDTENKNDSKASVKANVAYSVAVLLKEKDALIQPDMHLLGAQKEVRNTQNVVSATLQNAAPRLIKKLETKASIYKKGATKLLYQAEKTGMEMAPNTKFNFGVPLGNQKIKAGKYLMKVSGKADGKPYHFEQEFTITDQDVKNYEKNTSYAAKDNSLDWLWLLLACLVVLLLLGLACLMLSYEKKKRKQTTEEQND